MCIQATSAILYSQGFGIFYKMNGVRFIQLRTAAVLIIENKCVFEYRELCRKGGAFRGQRFRSNYHKKGIAGSKNSWQFHPVIVLFTAPVKTFGTMIWARRSACVAQIPRKK